MEKSGDGVRVLCAVHHKRGCGGWHLLLPFAYMTESDVSSYLADNIGNYLSDFVTQSYLSEAGFVTESYLSDAISDFVSESCLSDAISDFMRRSDMDSYLSEAGCVTDNNFGSALGTYLSEYGGLVIYNAISQYINPES